MAELYFIGGMFVLIMVICTVTMVFFVRVYRQEQREKIARKMEKEKRKIENGKPNELKTENGKWKTEEKPSAF